MSTTNVSANKPFLQNTMPQVLAYGQQATWTGTVTQSGTTLTFVSTTSTGVALNIGSIIGISGKKTVTIVSLSGGVYPAIPANNSTATVNVSQDVTTTTSASASGSSWWGSVAQSGTTLTATTAGGALTVGSLIYITGALPVTVLSAGSGPTIWTVNSSQTVGSASAYTISYKVQNLLNTFLNSVSETNYNYLFAGISAGEYSITGPLGTSPNCGLRTLVTIDDGSVAIDTSKSTNTYTNFSKKISIVSSDVDSATNAITNNWTGIISIANGSTTLNIDSTTSGSPYFSIGDVISSTTTNTGNAVVTFTIASVTTAGSVYVVTSAATATTYVVSRTASITTTTLTVGTAGGNNINENHMSRPEMLLAMLSNNGTGFTSRYSSSLSAYQSYFAQRVGLTTEEPFGLIRLSVPAVV